MMSTHITEDLPQLLTGEAPREVTMSAAAHLRTCPDCQQELVSAVIAHSALSSAHRFAPELVVRRPSGEGDAADDRGETEEPVPSTESELPDLTDLFQRARAESATPPMSRLRRSSGRARWLTAAAAVVVLAGGGAAIATTVGSDGPPERSVALEASTPGDGRSSATLVGDDRIRIDATSLPRLDGTHQYEVWLTNAGTVKNPQAVGMITGDRTADLRVPPALLHQYDTIAVSKQQLRQTQYSGVLMLSGRY